MELNVEVQKNKQKQIIISTIFVVIFLLIFSWIYYALRPKPNCFDGKKNQNEQGIDCGGVCAKQCELISKEDIQVQKTGFVASGIANAYDIYGEITNPNNLLGSNYFNYEFKIKNAAGQVIADRTGTNFILPGETKDLIELNVGMQDTPAIIELTITGTKWVEFNSNDYQKPNIKVVNKIYNEISGGSGFSEAKGLLENQSSFDFATIEIYIILKNADGNIIALNSTSMNTVSAGENRDFRVFWPNRFSGEVMSVEVQTDVNVFDSQSFVKRYFNAEQFQQY